MRSASGESTPPTVTGREQFAVATRLAGAAWLLCAGLLILLYARPTASGAPYVLTWHRYFFLAVLHQAAGIALLSLPFLVTWLLVYTTALRSPRWLLVHAAHAAVMTGGLMLDHLDHEISRFMGMRLSVELLGAYFHANTSFRAIHDNLVMDRGGPYLPLAVWVAVPALYASWAARALRGGTWARSRPPIRVPRWAAALAIVIVLAVPFAVSRKTGRFRTLRVQPAVIGLGLEWWQGHRPPARPANLDVLAREYQAEWQAGSADRRWRFPSIEYPYVREPMDAPACDAGPPWNIIFLQLESFRGWDVGVLNPGDPPSPTPFIDSLATGPNGAYWDRFSTFGWPTMNGVLTAHASIVPHSQRFISTAFANVRLLGFPDALRRCGYRAEVFTVSDPDWDNLRVWLTRWYDRLWFSREAKQSDRPVFRTAAARIRELGRSGRPFLVTIVSFSNHTPFRPREPGFDSWGTGSPEALMKGTMRYTDAVVEELVNSLRAEPWFDHTLVVVTADHGFNLGEHDGQPTKPNLYREALWGPLVISGNHPRLPRGAQHDIASLLDVAPTIADLAGIRARNPWMGHSLVAGPRPDAVVATTSNEQSFVETSAFSLVTDDRTGRAFLYDASRDYLQRHDLAPRRPDLVGALLQRAAALRSLNDYVVATDRAWKQP